MTCRSRRERAVGESLGKGISEEVLNDVDFSTGLLKSQHRI
jgi:hypothetical protein